MAKGIVIADSDKADQEEFRKVFETTDYQLIFSESGEDALSRIKRFKPDLIIASGTSLREMGGLELCGAIKKDPELKHIPFILISNIFDVIPEKDRQRVQADGMILKPLDEDEILNLVDHLVIDEGIGKREEAVSKKQEESLLGLLGGEEEEDIIELFDVVEEPESRMNINDFVGTKKEEPFGEIISLESWEGLELKEKPEEREFADYSKKEKEIIEEMDLQLKREMAPKEAPSEKDLFEKIDLHEILDKVEQLKPSLEKEWPSEKDLEVLEKSPLQTEEAAEKYSDLSEFEVTLQNQVKTEEREPEIEPFPFEIPEKEILEEALPTEESVEGGELVEEEEQAGERELIHEEEPISEEELIKEEEIVEEGELIELPEEEFPDELLEEILREEEVSSMEEPRKAEPEEVQIEETQPEPIRMEKVEEFEAPRIFEEEVEPLVSKVSKEIEEVSLVKVVDKHLEEVIGKGIQDMVGDFITKILPEMTQHIMGLTADRIEKMVKEIIPDLAEKAIQEEIKQLKKGEKDE